MTIYAALLYGLMERLNSLIDRRTFNQRYGSEVTCVTRVKSGVKAEIFRLGIACSELHAPTSERPVWKKAATLMRAIIDDGTDDYQIFSLHTMLLKNPTYKATFTTTVKLPTQEEIVYDDDAPWTRNAGEVEN